MLGLEMVVLPGVALVICGALARRYPVAPAILLVPLLELRDVLRIDDIVLRRVEARLDIEEVRISRTIPAVE